MTFIASLIKKAGIPDGVFQTINGTKPTVDALLESPDVKAVSFVGSSPVAEAIQKKATMLGKRALCLGGAKNHLCVLPDADYDMCTRRLLMCSLGCFSRGFASHSLRRKTTVNENYFLSSTMLTTTTGTSDIMNSFAGSTGQRCMAASVLILVGDVKPKFLELLVQKASALKAGQEAGQIGPLIDDISKTRVLKYINEAESRDGAKVLVDGRSWQEKAG